MRKTSLIFLLALLLPSIVYAIPPLQLFVSGATYNWQSQTWVTSSGEFDLYVVNANASKADVVVSLALAQVDNADNVNVTFGGHQMRRSDWVWGYAPIEDKPDEWNGGDDLPRHGIFPTWYTEMHTGAYGMGTTVGNVQPDKFGNYWNPSTGRGATSAYGQVKSFHIVAGGTFSFVHFDAYTLNSDGTINQFAPFSHDAETISSVPEPATLALLVPGLLGLGIHVRRRKKY